MVWKAIARSVTGTRHQEQHLPCQDFGGDRILDDVLIGAIADGAGSAKHAEVGARLAVETALAYLGESEIWLQQRQCSWRVFPVEPLEKLTTTVFSHMTQQVVTVLQRTATEKRADLKDFSCTLLAFVATPHWLAAMQIGDGFIVVRSPNQTYQLLFQPDKGEYTNQTSFVTSRCALADMRTGVWTGSHPFICASTDGLESVAIHFKDWTPFPPFFKPLEEFLQEADPNSLEHNDSYLLNFLQSERLNQRTDDDKTLLLCCYE